MGVIFAQKILKTIEALGIPTLHFGTGTSTLLEAMRDAGGDVIGVDWRIPLDKAWKRVGYDRAVQGHLDPTLLLGPTDRLLEQSAQILRHANGRPGHIFNLGHGILPETPVENVQLLANFLHNQVGGDTTPVPSQ